MHVMRSSIVLDPRAFDLPDIAVYCCLETVSEATEDIVIRGCWCIVVVIIDVGKVGKVGCAVLSFAIIAMSSFAMVSTAASSLGQLVLVGLPGKIFFGNALVAFLFYVVVVSTVVACDLWLSRGENARLGNVSLNRIQVFVDTEILAQSACV